MVKVFHKSKEGRELLVEQEGEDVKIIISDGYSKAGVKLSIDETRALRDAMKRAIKASDEELIQKLNNSYSNYQETPQYTPQTTQYAPEPQKEEPVSTAGFFSNEPSPSYQEPPKEAPRDGFRLFNDEKPRKPRSELYY